MIIQCKIAIYFNAETRSRRVRRGSWSSELELESGGLGVRGQESGVRSQELEFRVGVGEWSWRAQLAVERKSERADTAYSPRFREEELPATANEHCRAQASLSDAAN